MQLTFDMLIEQVLDSVLALIRVLEAARQEISSRRFEWSVGCCRVAIQRTNGGFCPCGFSGKQCTGNYSTSVSWIDYSMRLGWKVKGA